jgi:DNA-binding XRE family transcriptional regulator
MDQRCIQFGTMLKAGREAAGLTQDQLASRVGTTVEAVAESENGTVAADWLLVDAVIEELEVRQLTARGSQLMAARSRLEAPLHGIPGTLCLCRATESGRHHWVRRARGQLHCTEHGEFLLPTCYYCGFRFAHLGEPAIYCPGCATPIGALLENEQYEEGAASVEDERESLAAMRAARPPSAVEPATIRRNRPATPADVLAAHNRHRELSVQTLRGRALEHYVAARTVSEQVHGGSFTRSELLAVYQDLAEGRSEHTVLPSDYCLHANENSADNPWFLLREQRGRYRFLGMDGQGDQDVPMPKLPASTTTTG